MLREGRRSRAIVVLAMVTAAAVLGTAGPAPAQAADPEIYGVDGFAPSRGVYVDCDGATQSEDYLEGGALWGIDDDIASDLTVPVTYSGSLAGSLDEAPSEVTFFAGDGYGEVYFTVDTVEPGDLTIALEPGAGYTLADDATITIEVTDDPDLIADCGEDLGSLENGADRQTIRVGETPQDLGLFSDEDDTIIVGSAEFPDGSTFEYQFGDVGAPDGFTTPVVNGSVPPGLTYTADRWSGTATTPGSYDFDVRVCFDEAVFGIDGLSGAGAELARNATPRAIPSEVCFGYFDVTIEVLAAQASDPGTTAPPATPVAADARFTG